MLHPSIPLVGLFLIGCVPSSSLRTDRRDTDVTDSAPGAEASGTGGTFGAGGTPGGGISHTGGAPGDGGIGGNGGFAGSGAGADAQGAAGGTAAADAMTTMDSSSNPPSHGIPDSSADRSDGSLEDGGRPRVVGLVEVATLSAKDGASVDRIDALHALDTDPTTLLAVSWNIGSFCGGGTPASVWKIHVDPTSGMATSVGKQQDLSQIQQVRGTLFESSAGTLHTGGGWCGVRPPYYSVDHGSTWQAATSGSVYPPNSTFSYAEFKGNTYAGTGYEPVHGQVYRWLGGGTWSLALDIPNPRSMVASMAVSQDALFVSSYVYGSNGQGCETSIPVYRSTNGTDFQATTGIPSCHTVFALAPLGAGLVAVAAQWNLASSTSSVYRLDSTGTSWAPAGHYPLSQSGSTTVVSNGSGIYAYGTALDGSDAGGGTEPGIFGSADGISWNRIVDVPGPALSSLTAHGDTLYAGTFADPSGVAHIYALRLPP
jgi:hypothetical protein